MGTWGSGNFDNDTSADYLSIVVGEWIDDIRGAMSSPECLEADEYEGNTVPCTIELLNLIGKQHYVGFTPPKPEEVTQWKETYMEVWLQSIDDLDPDEDYKQNRIKVLNKTFDDLITLAKEFHQD